MSSRNLEHQVYVHMMQFESNVLYNLSYYIISIEISENYGNSLIPAQKQKQVPGRAMDTVSTSILSPRSSINYEMLTQLKM